MSDRDDWQFDWRTRFTDQRLHDRYRSDRAQLPFVAPEDREDHRRQLEESRGLPSVEGVAMAALVAAGAYIGLRHFPSGLVRRASQQMRSRMDDITKRAKEGGWYERVRAAFSRSGPDARQGVARGIVDENLAKDIELARDIFATRSGYVGNRESVISGLLQRYAATNPYHIPMDEMPQQIRHLANLPMFRAAATRMGMAPAEVAGRLSQAATRPQVQTMGDVVRKISGIRFPFTQWKPLELLFPTEMVGRQPALARLAREALPDAGEASEGLFAAGRLFRVEEFRAGGQLYKAISAEAVGEGYQLGRLGSGMGRAAAERLGGTLARPLRSILAERPELESPRGLWDRIERAALEIGERYGVGPQYSTRIRFGGRARQLAEAVRNTAGRGGIEYQNVVNQKWGITPEGSWLRRQLGRAGLGRIGPVEGPQDLSWFERMKLRMGVEPQRTVEKMVGGRAVRERVPIAKFLDESGKPMVNRLPFAKTSALRGEFYAYKGARQGLNDWFNYHLNRPMWLLQEMTGVGLKMGKTPAESMWRIGTRVALPAYAAWQGLQYAEYKSRRWFGLGPISGPAYLYTQMRTEAQRVLDSAGITEKAEELEEKFPGLIESPFSKGVALAGGTFGGAALGRRVGAAKGGAIGAAAGLAAGLIFATGVTQDAETLKDIYQGEQEVPVHADRWWVLGRQPFGGSRVKYWKKHWFAEMMSDYRDKAIYGSKKESWRGSWLPVPENWFTLKNFYDPYYVENLNYHERPYPTTSPMFEELPLVGPVAGATIGRLIKPIRRRPLGDIPGSVSAGMPSDVRRGQEEAVAMGLQPAPIPEAAPTTKWTMRQLTGETLNRLFDWTGMPGFMLSSIKENLTGQRGWMEDEQVLAASGMMTASERSFYEKNLGGLLGSTELLRRFIPKRRRNPIYNPIENVAPEWLPGHRSVFPGDRAGYLDFHTGDPYTRLEKGEARLPGRGYEALHEMHSGAPGVYDDFDRFKILADVAPYSEAFKHYKRLMQTQVEQGVLSDQDVKRYYRTIDNQQIRAESKVSSYNNRFSTGAFASDTVTIQRIMSPTEFTVSEMPGVTFQLAGVKDRPADMDGTQLGQYKRLKSRMYSMVGDQVRMTWGGPGVTTPAIIGDVNQNAIEAGLEADRLHGLGYRAKYGGGGLPSAWESLIHTQMPGPFDYPRTKWLGTRSTIEEYEQFQVYGTADTNWSHPFKNYILPWFHSATRTQTAESARARQITEYMDNLKYVKNQRLAGYATGVQDTMLAQSYQQRAGQTMVALNAQQPNFWKDVYRAMPPAERPYFNVFAGTTSEAEQERIIQAVPDYMKRHYMGLWKRKMPLDSQFNSPILRHYEKLADDQSRVPVDDRVSEFFASYPTPPKDWMGWHPGVDLEAVTIKTANQEGVDIHQLGYWESQALQAERTYPFVEPIPMDTGADLDLRDNILGDMHRDGYTDLNATPSWDEGGSINFKMRRKKSAYRRAWNSPYNAGQYTGGTW
jgi:hypothetical protein